MDKSKSVLARLKNKSKQSGKDYQLHMQLFCQEELLRRISKSTYNENFVLKGGLLIYTLSGFEGRSTVDMDFLLRHIENSMENVQSVVEEIIHIETGNDYITYEITGCEKISVDKKYNGISIQLIAKIANTRTPLHMDFGIGDVIVPESETRRIMTQLDDFEEVDISTYSLESTVAEKVDAILQRFELTSRMKDFYDIYYIGSNFDFKGEVLFNAIKDTVHNRGTVLELDSFDRIDNLRNNEVLLRRWSAFQKKFLIELSFEEAIKFLDGFIREILYTIASGNEFNGEWNSKEQSWQK